jgi:hypothetical protein
MTAQVEKVIMDADAIDSKQLGPDIGENRLSCIARCDELGRGHPDPIVDCGQRSPIDLPVSGQRHALQEDEACGDHIVEKPTLEKVPKLIVPRLPASLADNVSDQSRRAPVVISQQYCGRVNVGVRKERLLDFAELDPTTSDLYLIVDASKKLKRSIRSPSGQVTGPVQAISFTHRERVGDKASPS